MTDAEFQSAVTADIKALIARCVCGAEDYPTLERVSQYRQTYRITCDACGRVLYSPTQMQVILDWERICSPLQFARCVAQEKEIAALKLALDACVDSAFEHDKTSSALLAGVNKVLALIDDEADADMDSSGRYHPNTAMRIATELREAIAKAKA